METMKAAKVIHLITKMELGGAQQNTIFTVSNLDPKKFDTFLIAGKGGELSDEANQLKNIFTATSLIREIKPFRDIKALIQIIRIIKHIQKLPPLNLPIIVHTHSSKAGILGRWAARIAAVPIIVHSVHGFGFNDWQPAYLRKALICAEKFTSIFTSRFIAVSMANKKQGIDLKIFTPEKVQIIRSGIDILNFCKPVKTRHQVRKNLGIPENAPLVGMIACLKPQKAPLDYVKVCCLVKQKIPDAHFLLTGDGTLRPEVEKKISELHLNTCFHLTGWRRDIPDILHAIDVLALTSLWEGLPRVLPQAMSAGIPIVATKVDGSPEAVKDNVNGFLVLPGDVPEIAKKITFLLLNPEKARSMGRKGLGMVEEFDIFKMVRDQEDLYEQQIKNWLKSVSQTAGTGLRGTD